MGNDITIWRCFFGESKTNMLGFDEKDFKNFKDFTTLLHPDDYEKAMQDMRDHLEGKKDFYETDYRIKHKDGHYLHFYDCGQIVKKEGDNITVAGFVMKIDDSKKVQDVMKNFKELILKGEPSMVDLIQKIK